MSRRPTLAELAQTLGLSVNTVSRALSGRDGVSARTRARVVAEARKVGYLPGRPAEPAAREGQRIVLSIPSPLHPFSAELLTAVDVAARDSGVQLDVVVTDENPERERHIVRQLAESSVAGAVVIPVHADDSPWATLWDAGMPLVTVSRDLAAVDCDFVGIDSDAGQYAVVRHLLAHGARSIVQLDEDLDITTISGRRAGFDRAIAESGTAEATHLKVPSRRFETGRGSWRAEEAYRAVSRHLDGDEQFDAIATGDDDFALGALRALREHGLSVPADVLVAGYGDQPYGAWLSPSLTSVRLQAQVAAESALSGLLRRIAGDTSGPLRRHITPELTIRESSVPR